MNQDEHKIVVRRMAGLIAAASVLIAVYVLRLIFLQLVNSDSFKAQATNTTDYNFTVTAARGDIVDSAGRRIAASTTSYNVVLSKLLMGDEDLDAMLQRIVELLEAHGEKWNDSLLIGEPDAAGHYSFTAQADSTSDQKALAAMKDSLGLQQYATADDVMEKLVEDYKLESYPFHWQRVLGGIHYEMQQQAFSNVNNFVMAENVSEVTVATIKENSLTAMMVTHNMRDAIAHGNRLIMMNNGQVVLNISGEEKKNLTVEDLLMKFEEVSGEEFASDKALLG